MKGKKQGFYSFFLQTLESLKKQGFVFLHALKAKKREFFFANFRMLEKPSIVFLFFLKGTKIQGFYFFFSANFES